MNKEPMYIIKGVAAVTAVWLLAGCVSPYQDALKIALDQCNHGDQTACSNATTLTVQDNIWHREQERHAAHILAGLALGAAIGAAAYSASRPTYVYQPTPYISSPVYTHTTSCMGMDLGGGMSTLNCN